MKTLPLVIVYGLVAVAGAVLIVWAANQNTTQTVPEWIAPAHGSIHTTPVLGDIAKLLRSSLVKPPPPKPQRRPPSISIASREKPAPSPSPDTSPPDETAPLTDAGTPPPPEPARDRTATAVVAIDNTVIPPGGHWAIVASHDARLYDVAGKNMGPATVGSLAIVKRQAKSGKKQMLVCRGQKDAKPFILAKADVILYPGSPEGLSDTHRGLIVEFARLSADRDQLEKKLRSGIRSDNPHGKAFASAKSEYVTFWKTVKRLRKQREDTRGDAHMEAADELRKMKGQDIRIGQAYEQGKQRYEAWNSAHPPPSTIPELTRLDEKLEIVQAQIDALQP
jgi:hypothetical protein